MNQIQESWNKAPMLFPWQPSEEIVQQILENRQNKAAKPISSPSKTAAPVQSVSSGGIPPKSTDMPKAWPLPKRSDVPVTTGVSILRKAEPPKFTLADHNAHEGLPKMASWSREELAQTSAGAQPSAPPVETVPFNEEHFAICAHCGARAKPLQLSKRVRCGKPVHYWCMKYHIELCRPCKPLGDSDDEDDAGQKRDD